MDRLLEAEAVGEATTEVSQDPRGVLMAMDRHAGNQAGLAAPGTVSVRQR